MDPERFRIKPTDYYDPDDDLSTLKPASNSQSSNDGGYKKPSSGNRALKIGLSLAVVLVIVGLGTYLLITNKPKPAKQTYVVKTATSIKSKTNSTTGAVNSPPMTSYASSSYGATFSYPSNWKLVNNGPGAPITVTSPIENLINENGQKVPAEVTMNLSNQATTPSTFGNTSAAVLTSQKLTYKHASASQAASTYISFVQYPSTTVVGGLNGIYVTGNYGYQKYQLIPVSQINQVDPLIYFSFTQCQSLTSCSSSSPQPLVISSTEWADANFSTPIINIIASFNFN